FNYRNFGDSNRQPRDEVSHYSRLQDWQDAISYATSLPEIDSQKIGIWGTSLGGRDILAITSFDRRVKAVVAQAPLIKWTPALAARMAGFSDNLDSFQGQMAEDRKTRTLGKEPRYLPFVKPSGDDVKDAFIKRLSNTDKRKPAFNFDVSLVFQGPLIFIISSYYIFFIKTKVLVISTILTL
ncbi:MAG: hypothetical protein Q9180_004829, partial [Flavoplaca navasiana]